MATQKKSATGNIKFLKVRIAAVNKALGKLEGEVEKAVNRFMKQGEKSSRIVKKNFDEIFDRISSSDFYSKASEKTEEITKDIRKLADEVVAKVKQFDFKRANSILKEVRENLDQIVEKIQGVEFVEIARDRAKTTRNQVLTALKIPTQDELNQLSRKVTVLEKKIKTLSTKKAA